jgi:hypothetical protein
MKATKITSEITQAQLDEMSKTDMILVKTTIVLFTIVLNICFFQLFI